MCSISGIYLKPHINATLSDLESLSAPLSHRGPDGCGHFIDNNIGLFHYRLAINDLSTTGIQPFTSTQGTVAITNGEIYNVDDIKRTLASVGDTPWQSHSDCEVIPYLYDYLGPNFTESLRGMYSIAVFHPKSRKLILSRDPYGMKQLYYTETTDGVFFASEPRAIHNHINNIKPDIESLLTTADIHFTVGRETGFEGIHRLLPGESITVLNGNIVKHVIQKPPQKTKRSHSLDHYIKTFDNIFEETIDKHLLSDVPIGLFLSGGIDSTSILTMLSRFKKTPIHSFTIGFDSHETHDECQTSRALAQHFQTDHTEITFSEDDFWHYLPQAIKASDDPTADYAIVPTFKLAEAAKHTTPVVLSGEGGDELFAGYGRYRHFSAPFWRRKNMYRKGSVSSLGLLKSTHYAQAWQKKIATITKILQSQTITRLDLAQHIDQSTWLPNDLLIKLDRMLMWHNLEGRTPFLDNEMYRFASQLPDNIKSYGKHGKWILRCWLNQQISFYDPYAKKKGFSVPIRDWLDRRRGKLSDYLITHQLINDTIKTTKLKQLLSTPLNKKEAMAIWGLLYIAGWYDIHILDVPLSM